MKRTVARILRIAAELLVIAAAVTAVVTGMIYAWEAPYFDHPHRGENAWRNFVKASVVLSSLGAVAAGVLWLAWRHRAALDTQPDAPARFLAVAVATLPEVRRDWGVAMMAELSSITDSSARWRFAASSARAALFPPAEGRRPATGRFGAAVAVLGVIACVTATGYLSLVYPGTLEVTSALVIAALVVFLAACLSLALIAPPALTSSVMARRAGLFLGIGSGLGLLLFSRTDAVEMGAMTFIVPAQFLIFVIAPIIALGTTIGTNLGDAVSWVLIVVPGLMIPLGILGAALAIVVVRGAGQALRRTSSDAAAAGNAGSDRTSGS
jgi:hypothetical protein